MHECKCNNMWKFHCVCHCHVSRQIIRHFNGISPLVQPYNGLFSRTTWVSRYKKGKTKLYFTEARESEWQWHQLGHMQVCTSFQTDNHACTSPLRFLQARCPSCRPTNSVKALKAINKRKTTLKNTHMHTHACPKKITSTARS